MNILDFLDRAETAFGDRIGIVDEPDQPASSWGELTWSEVAVRVRAMAAGLDALGVGFGERVAIVSQNSARLLTALFAVSGYGRVVVPINFRLNADEIRYIVDHSGASMLLIDPELDEALADVDVPLRFVMGEESDRVLMRYDREPIPWGASEDAIASINYTSGTTARPKGVQLTHRNLYMNAMTFGWHAGVNDRDVYLWPVPMFHCNGWGMVYAITGMGGRHVILRRVDGHEILRRVEEHGVTFMGGAPAVVNLILSAAANHPGGSWRPGRVRMVVGGAPPPTSTIERVETELGWEFMQVYGLTETSPLLTINRRRAEWDELTPTERARMLGRAGAPALGVKVRVDEEGEVLARGNVVFGGYWLQPEATAEAIDGWLVPHRRRRKDGRSGLPDDLRPQEGRDHHRRRERVVDRGRGRALSASRRRRSSSVRDPRHQVGRDGEGARGAEARDGRDEAELIAHCRALLAHYKCPTSIDFGDGLADGDGQGPEVQAPRAVLGGTDANGQLTLSVARMTDAALTDEALDALRQSVERLHGLVAPMDDSQLEAQAYPKEWRVADVLSHIGSSAVIMSERFRGLRGESMADDFAPAVWEAWNAKSPRAKADDALVADRAQLGFSLGPMQFDFGGLVGLRLNEHTLHTWDIEVVDDPTAELVPSGTRLVIDNLGLIGRFTGKAQSDGRA